MHRFPLIMFLVLSASPLAAQKPTPPVEELLNRIYAYAATYRATLPSLECDEALTSQRLKKGRVIQEVKVESVLRNLRVPDTGKGVFAESRIFKTVDGQTPPATFTLPYMAQLGFANVIGFSRAGQEDCYDWRLTPLDAEKVRLELNARRTKPASNCQDIPELYHKIVVAQAATGRILSVERSMSAKAALRYKEVFFSNVVFEPRTLGDETFWLPAVLNAHDEDQGRMTAVYTNCHRYQAKVTIEPVP